MRLLCLTFLIALSSLASAQPQGPDTLWSRVFTELPYASPKGLAALTTGEFIVSGDCGGGENYDLFLMHLDSLGHRLDVRTYGNPNDYDLDGFLCTTPDGGFALAGTYRNQGDRIMVLRLNAVGDTLWRRHFAYYWSPYVWTICPAQDGGFIVGGDVVMPDNGHTVWFWMKISDEGDSLWTQIYRGSSNGMVSGIRRTMDGGYAVVGSCDEDTTMYANEDIRLAKTDGLGQIEWVHTYGAPGEPDVGYDVAALNDGYLIVGSTAMIPDRQYMNTFLIRTDVNGDTLWTRVMPRENYSWASQVIRTADGNLTVGGNSYQNQTVNATLIRLTPAGEILWLRDYPIRAFYYGPPLVFTVDAQGRYLMATDRNDNEMYLMQTAPDPTFASVPNVPITTPTTLTLMQNYPNPFNSATNLSFSIPHTENIALQVYNVNGQLVRTLVNERLSPGEHTVRFDGGDLPSGVYLYRLASPSFTQTRKMILLK
jgi:hypothetical protein